MNEHKVFITKMMIGFLLLALTSGCQDVGPVGMYSKALFNKDVNLPELDFSRYAVTACSDATLIPKQGLDVWIQVFLKNKGGSSTLGFVSADLSINPAFGTPHQSFNSGGTAYTRAYFGQKGKAIELNTEYAGSVGYPEPDSSVVIVDPSASYEFHVLSGSGSDVPMNLQIADPYGNRWQQSFTVHIY
jgi:hypothetical protein